MIKENKNKNSEYWIVKKGSEHGSFNFEEVLF